MLEVFGGALPTFQQVQGGANSAKSTNPEEDSSKKDESRAKWPRAVKGAGDGKAVEKSKNWSNKDKDNWWWKDQEKDSKDHTMGRLLAATPR